MATTWIVAADESRARVLQVARPEKRLQEIEDMLNPEGRMQDRDLQTDAEPRFHGRAGGGPASDRETQGASEHSARMFAKEVGRYLEKARVEHRFDELVLVAPPKFLGALRKELDKEVGKLVKEELPKDLSWLNARDLEAWFRKSAR
jgi:protein required for attachment to host cells